MWFLEYAKKVLPRDRFLERTGIYYLPFLFPRASCNLRIYSRKCGPRSSRDLIPLMSLCTVPSSDFLNRRSSSAVFNALSQLELPSIILVPMVAESHKSTCMCSSVRAFFSLSLKKDVIPLSSVRFASIFSLIRFLLRVFLLRICSCVRNSSPGCDIFAKITNSSPHFRKMISLDRVIDRRSIWENTFNAISPT